MSIRHEGQQLPEEEVVELRLRIVCIAPPSVVLTQFIEGGPRDAVAGVAALCIEGNQDAVRDASSSV